MSANKISLQQTMKSQDTEEWLDVHFTRPIGFMWAKFFDHFNVHPNVVTIISMFLGVAAGVMFYYSDLLHNIIGVLLLMWANFYDSCDGQLARMTGKKTRWGRILDGFAGDLWFFVIYWAISLRCDSRLIPGTDIQWGIWIYLVCTFSGFICHARQCKLADYYRNVHLHFLAGVDDEFDTSESQQILLANTPKKGNFWWRLFLRSYARYTKSQERLTPHLQQMMGYIRNEMGGKVSRQFCEDFRQKSLPYMKYANILTFNCRAITLYVACLIDEPWLYPIVEITLFSIMSLWMQYSHEHMCKAFYNQLKESKYNNI